MDNPVKLVLLSCLLALVVGDVTVTPFTQCTQCGVQQVAFPSSTVFLMRTADNIVWRSADEGQHWTSVGTNINYIETSTVDPMSVIFVSGTTLFASTDGGATTTKYNFPVTFVSGVTMHPSQAAWLMVYTCNSLSCNTYYSKDFGKSWKQGPSNMAVDFILWGHDPTLPDIVFGVKSNGWFSYTQDYGSTWTQLLQNSIGWYLSDNYLYVGVIKSGSTARLYSSSSRLDPTHTQSQYYWLDEFPTGNDLAEYGYTFLDDATRSEFIAVVQPTSDIWGTLYSSDFDGDQFALSLNYLAQDKLSYDFDQFNGLDGIFVANAYPSATSKNRQTLFSYDNGGEWKLVNAPKVNSYGVATNCSLSAGCSLHLHGQTSWYGGLFPPAYTSPNAIGLMVAVGNLGQSLSMTSNKGSSTYFTRDGGITWKEIYDQPSIYEFGDHGGILVFAPISVATTTIWYSLDEGLTKQSFTFSTTPMMVDNIWTEPQGTGLKFVLMAHTGSGPTNKDYLFGLDFSTLNLPQCQDSDYENWSPSNGDNLNTNCFMGSTTIYLRRKQTSQCYNARDTDHVIQSTPCPCDWEDYECDVGFTPSTRNATDYFTCSPIHATPSCATGYRLIPDTTCDLPSGINLQSSNCPGYSGTPTTITTSGTGAGTGTASTGSPAQTTGSTTGGDKGKGGSHTGAVVAVVLIFFILLGAAGAAGFLYYRNENFREWVLSKFARTPAQGYGRLNTDENDEAPGSPTIA